MNIIMIIIIIIIIIIMDLRFLITPDLISISQKNFKRTAWV